MLSPTKLRTHQSVFDSVALKFAQNPQYTYTPFVHDTLTHPELVCWFLDELYLSVWGDFSGWFDRFVNTEVVERDMRPVLEAIFAQAPEQYKSTTNKLNYLVASSTFSIERVDLFKRLYQANEDNFTNFKEYVVSHWPDTLDPLFLPEVTPAKRKVSLAKSDQGTWFPEVELSLLQFIVSDGGLRKEQCINTVVNILWEKEVAVTSLVEASHILSESNPDNFIYVLEEIITVVQDGAYEAYQEFIKISATPTWWKNYGVIVLPETMTVEVITYLDLLGEQYLNYQILPESMHTISDAIKSGSRMDPLCIVFKASDVTSDDLELIRQAANVMPVLFFGENSLLQSK